MADRRELVGAAREARAVRKEEQDTLIGFCFENAEAMSRALEKRGISHELHYVGIINDVFQTCSASVEQCLKAAETGEYEDEVPETKDDLPHSANHYIITVNDGGAQLVCEPCSETRGGAFRNVYVGEWPTKDYLPLKDSLLNRYEKFSYDDI